MTAGPQRKNWPLCWTSITSEGTADTTNTLIPPPLQWFSTHPTPNLLKRWVYVLVDSWLSSRCYKCNCSRLVCVCSQPLFQKTSIPNECIHSLNSAFYCALQSITTSTFTEHREIPKKKSNVPNGISTCNASIRQC